MELSEMNASREGQRKKHHRLSRILVIVPIFFSVSAGFVVIGKQYWGWQQLGSWPPFALHDVLSWWIGRPFPTYRVETAVLSPFGWPDSFRGMERGLVALDGVTRWLLDSVPLALWLIVVLPAIWFMAWTGIFQAVRLLGRRPGSTIQKGVTFFAYEK
jgi:hypothetical protein